MTEKPYKDPRDHLRKERMCMNCGRVIRGNAFFTHKKACEARRWFSAKVKP